MQVYEIRTRIELILVDKYSSNSPNSGISWDTEKIGNAEVKILKLYQFIPSYICYIQNREIENPSQDAHFWRSTCQSKVQKGV